MTKIDSNNKTAILGYRNVLTVLFLVISTLSIYWQVHNYDFVNIDDGEYIIENRNVRTGLSFENIAWAFTAMHAGNWHPVTWISHMMDCQFFGINPGWHHIINVFFHMANSLLLFAVFKNLTGNYWQSFFVAALFAFHPLHVESVAWISERKDVLSTLFWILTMLSYIWYTKHPGIYRYLWVLLFFILGLMSKPMLVTLPLVLLLLDYWPLDRLKMRQEGNGEKQKKWRINPKCLLEKIPLLILTAISSVITFLVQKHGGAVSSLDVVSFNMRITNALVSYVSYIGKMVWPSNLAVLYPYAGEIQWWKIFGASFLLVSVTLFVIKHVSRRPYLAVGWFWYIGTLIPVIGIVQVGNQAMADRYTYIPLIGLFIIVIWGIFEIASRRRRLKVAFSIIAAAILIGFVIISFYQVKYWKNSITLYKHTLDATTNNCVPHNNLGIALQKQGKIDEAIGHYLNALRIKPDMVLALNNLGLALDQKNRIKEAIKHYLEALKIKPDYEEAHNNLGNALQKQKKIGEAIACYSEALRIRPDYEEAHNNLGIALQRQGKIDEAIKHYQEALRLNTHFDQAHNNLGIALFEKGNVKAAIGHFREAIRIRPDYIQARRNLEKVLEMQGIQ